MFGHIEEPWELAEHMRVVRELQERTGGFTEFVPLSFIPFHTLLGRTHGVEEISREENLKHTAVFRLALGRSVPNLQASWVKMGLDAATEALRWGVNDLGGTLMEETISRLAGSYHGVRLDPPEPRSPPRTRRPPGRRAHDAVRAAARELSRTQRGRRLTRDATAVDRSVRRRQHDAVIAAKATISIRRPAAWSAAGGRRREAPPGGPAPPCSASAPPATTSSTTQGASVPPSPSVPRRKTRRARARPRVQRATPRRGGRGVGGRGAAATAIAIAAA